VSSDTQPAINLEVTVPRILLPPLYERPTRSEGSAGEEEEQPNQQAEPVEEKADDLDREQVRLSSINVGPASRQTQVVQVGELSTYTTRQGPFHLFRIDHILAHGQAQLLQVLRRGKGRERPQRNSRDAAPLRVTDELAFILKFRHNTAEDAAEAAREALLPGWNQVVIVLDEENAPITYSIDGSER
jgi:hypothetical protein